MTDRDGGAVKMSADDVHAFFGETEAVRGITLPVLEARVTAIIGPSGCGKSTMVRCINRMHEEIPGARTTGRVMLDDTDLYANGVGCVAHRPASRRNGNDAPADSRRV